GPAASTVALPPCLSTSRTASSTAHSSCGPMVNPRWRVSMSRPSSVSGTLAPGAGTRLTQTRMSKLIGSRLHPCIVRVEQRFPAHAGDRHRVLLAQVVGLRLRPLRRVLRRQIRHQQVLAERRAGARAGDVRTAALAVDDPPTVPSQNRLAA